MKKVIVTGATGFIGAHVLPSLLARGGFEVCAVSRRGGEVPAGVRLRVADLLDPVQASTLLREERASHLLHLAWYVVPKLLWTSLENLAWVRASLHLLSEFRACGGARVVAIGTCAEYDWRHGTCSENLTPIAPSSMYGVCKAALGSMLAALGKETGLGAAWGRPFFLYGPRESPERLIPSLITAILRGEPARVANPALARDFLHVRDAADACVALLESDVQGAVNIASGVARALGDLADAIGARLGRPELVERGAKPSDEPPLVVADVRRLERQVGWKPQWDLDRGLEDTIRWWSEESARRRGPPGTCRPA